MFYHFELTSFPQIQRLYSVTRNTVWQITEKEHLLIYIQEGCCEFSYDSETHIVHKNDLVFIPANHAYIRKSVDNTLCTMTYFHFSLSDNIIQASARNLIDIITEQKKKLDLAILCGDSIYKNSTTIYLQGVTTTESNDYITGCLKEINLHSSKRQIMCSLQSSIHLCDAMATLSQMTIDTILTNTTLQKVHEIPTKLEHAIRYITTHYSEPISLTELAKYCNVSKQQIIRYFRSVFHTTPNNYITDFKLARAKEYLFYHPEISIKEIAQELGYDNQYYFSRVFSKKNRETPSQYRYRVLHYKGPDSLTP